MMRSCTIPFYQNVRTFKRCNVLTLFLAFVFSLYVPICVEAWEQMDVRGGRLFFQPIHHRFVEAFQGTFEDAYREAAQVFAYTGDLRVQVFLTSSAEEFRSLTRGRIPDWGRGCAFPDQRVIVLKAFEEDQRSIRETISHELSHVMLHQAVGGQPIPRWFDEGVAMWQAKEWRIGQSMRMAEAVVFHRVISLGEIEHVLSFNTSKAQLAYVESFLSTLFLLQMGGRDVLQRMVKAMEEGQSFERALYRVTGYTPVQFARAWEQYARRRYNVALILIHGPYFWIGMVGLFLLVYGMKRRRNKRKVQEWEQEERLLYGEDDKDGLIYGDEEDSDDSEF